MTSILKMDTPLKLNAVAR